MNTATATKLDVHIRWMIRRDMPAVQLIESASFDHPWSEDTFITVLRKRNCIAMVAERDERICGYMVYELFKSRLEILNLAVDPGLRLRGIGRQMVNKLAGKLSHDRRSRLGMTVRETNLDAQLFLKACGFRAIAVMPDEYDAGDDGYRFIYRICQGRR